MVQGLHCSCSSLPVKLCRCSSRYAGTAHQPPLSSLCAHNVENLEATMTEPMSQLRRLGTLLHAE